MTIMATGNNAGRGRQFVGGTHDVRGKAAAHFLKQKAEAANNGQVVTIELRSDRKARITPSDLYVWAKEQRLRIAEKNGVFTVEAVSVKLDQMATTVATKKVADFEIPGNSLITTNELFAWATKMGFIVDQVGPTTFRVGKQQKLAS
jgi:hypothetical protein